MSEDEYRRFLESREEIVEAIPQLGGEKRIARLLPRTDFPRKPFLIISTPAREESFVARSITLNLADEAWQAIVPKLKFFPETKRLSARRGRFGLTDYYSSKSFETTPFPIELLRGLLDLPYLREFATDGVSFSDESTSVLAQHPSLSLIELGRCRITTEAFSRLADLQTLEELGFVSGLTPECFVTLAKLPRFRRFAIYGIEGEFNQPISDTTRAAIESMDGRLEVFWAETIGITIHADVFRALLNVKSLKVLQVDSVGPGLTLDDLRVLKDMPNLTKLGYPLGGSYFDPAIRDEADALILEAIQRADARRLAETTNGKSIHPNLQ